MRPAPVSRREAFYEVERGAELAEGAPELAVRCTRCRLRFMAAKDRLSCPRCGEGLVLAEGGGWSPPEAGERSIWAYAGALLQLPAACRVTLGEGSTPLVHVGPVADVWVKNEGANPTRSYKDRFNAVNVSVAKALGARGVALISTGNAGVSAATYGLAAGLDVRVICSHDVPAPIVAEIGRCGAAVQLAGSPTERLGLLLEALADGFFPGSRSVPAVAVTPFGCLGYQTIAYEIVAQLGRAPGTVALPVGGGDGIYGVYRGFVDLRDAGVVGSIPRLVAARTTSRLAPSIAFDQVGAHALEAIRASSGTIVYVAEDQLKGAVADLHHAGLSAEPASAAAWAALQGAQDAVAVLTGAGGRWQCLLDDTVEP